MSGYERHRTIGSRPSSRIFAHCLQLAMHCIGSQGQSTLWRSTFGPLVFEPAGTINSALMSPSVARERGVQ